MDLLKLAILAFTLSVVHVSTAEGEINANVITAPIIPSKLKVIVKRFAQIPPYNGQSAKIISITNIRRQLYVCTLIAGRIYKVSRKGSVSLWFDVAAAMQSSTGRPLEISNRSHGGLRSLAFHPHFKKNGLFYTSVMELRSDEHGLPYFSRGTNDIPSESVVIEWRVDLKTGVPIPNSYRQVIRIGMPVYDHPIKQIKFHGDLLYITHGDGSFQSAKAGGGQRNDGLGKILRINPLQSGKLPYTVPASNPFVGIISFKDEIFTYGFRNPHNLCFSKSGELFVVDVGRDNVEEINIVQGGGNYGWSKREGPFVHLDVPGIGNGVGPLPDGDERFGYVYPNVVVGHNGVTGGRFVSQALAGSCPIENGSKLNGTMLYANFASTGRLLYSRLDDMRRAVVMGKPEELTQATTFSPQVLFDHDGDRKTKKVRVQNLREIVRMDMGRGVERVDLRFGQGRLGEIYWSSKTNGAIYVITTSERRRRRGP